MDVSACTSHSEGLSITLLESMRQGLPIVATAVGGNPEVVAAGETGFLVPPREPEVFAQRVAELLDDAELRARFGEAARRRIAEHFDLRRTARRYADLYTDLCASRESR
jgi:glycosyltransferase involved in cell wall biosynthesis